MITVKRKVHLTRRARGRLAITEVPPVRDTVAAERVPRVSRLMALAIHCDRLIRDGKVGSLSELARLACVTQPRMAQIMNLNHLAPDIQEEILFLPRVEGGRDPTAERHFRSIAAISDWGKQRKLFRELSFHRTEQKPHSQY